MPPRKKSAAPATGAPVSMADLARELGVSMTTISRALSDHHSIGPEMKRKVLKLAKKYNYQPNRLASALRKGRSKLLGIIVPYIEGRFFARVVHGMETAARQAGYHVIICQSNEEEAQERRNIEALLNLQVAGILTSVARTTRDYQHFDQVTERGVPLVFFDRRPDERPVHAVVLDDQEGGYLATRHLLQQGCRRVAHVAGPQYLNIYRNRRLGYLQALQEAGIPPDEALISYGDMSQEAGAAALRQWLKLPAPPDAVFAAGDYAALGVMEAALSSGLAVPGELAVVGFSNETFTVISKPAISSVEQRCEEMGQAAVRLLLELIEADGSVLGPRQLVLHPELLVRASSQRLEVSAAPKETKPRRK
ncbi:LacI family DNA-binding transcriptional regulator [Hymenobacter jeollabukensis]|uniref:LacI family transcriptional regulator n=1 Tax=Hymenobacter jeollabukensis TaxID=2025313 RepID=A0A5R8WJV8_9BACT|nr:LacI family DNA-binding transcriptional regulator [Hymenobacter jeollabukensis]TLM89111.1 LacI family transcriptional regulator [Hymenobacter jeollabukensis]